MNPSAPPEPDFEWVEEKANGNQNNDDNKNDAQAQYQPAQIQGLFNHQRWPFLTRFLNK